LRIKIFADGANLNDMAARNQDPLIAGFTTNPTLMRKSAVTDYEQFAKSALQLIPDKPISFEAFSDDFAEMERQVIEIASWGDNVYVKVPVTNSRGESSLPLIKRLVDKSVRLNVTAVTSIEQAKPVVEVLAGGPASIVSIMAGRIADTGRDPVETVSACVDLVRDFANIEILWASPREIYNLIQANQIGCHIITMTEDLLKKVPLLNMSLLQMSLDTVAMFHRDAQASAYTIEYTKPAAR
jgi:transaldolase